MNWTNTTKRSMVVKSVSECGRYIVEKTAGKRGSTNHVIFADGTSGTDGKQFFSLFVMSGDRCDQNGNYRTLAEAQAAAVVVESDRLRADVLATRQDVKSLPTGEVRRINALLAKLTAVPNYITLAELQAANGYVPTINPNRGNLYRELCRRLQSAGIRVFTGTN